LKYWIGVGAEVTDGAYRVLSMAGFLPKKPPPFGTKALYNKPAWLPGPEPPQPVLPDLGAAENIRDIVETTEKNVQKRKDEYINNARSQFHKQDKSPTDQINDYLERYNLYEKKLKEIIPNTPKDRLTAILSLITIGADEQNDIIYQAETLSEKLNIPIEKAANIIKAYEESFQDFEQADLDDFDVNLSRMKRVSKFKPEDKVYVPIHDTVTPMPDLENYEDLYPGDFHGIKTSLRPNKEYGVWFDKMKEEQRSYEKQKHNYHIFDPQEDKSS
jgi:hypothetical protein